MLVTARRHEAQECFQLSGSRYSAGTIFYSLSVCTVITCSIFFSTLNVERIKLKTYFTFIQEGKRTKDMKEFDDALHVKTNIGGCHMLAGGFKCASKALIHKVPHVMLVPGCFGFKFCYSLTNAIFP